MRRTTPDLPDQSAGQIEPRFHADCAPSVSFFIKAIVALALLLPALVQGATVVVIRSSDAEPYVEAEKALHDRLVAKNYVVRSVSIKEASTPGVDTHIGRPDVVVAIGTPSARWVHKQLPADIRFVYCMVSNAADAGLLQGRSSIGVTTDVDISQQISLIAEALPRARSVGLLYRSNAPESVSSLQMLEEAVPGNWTVQAVAVNDFPSVADAIDSLTQKNVDVIWTTPDQKLYDTPSVRTLLLAAVRAKIPVWGFSPAFVRAGALIGVGVEPAAEGNQAADLVIKAINNPKTIKREADSPQEFQIAVNLMVAEQIGLEIPESLTKRAAFVFKPEN
jgi:ABC-type uncharacterized transport system substrate-binding protein